MRLSFLAPLFLVVLVTGCSDGVPVSSYKGVSLALTDGPADVMLQVDGMISVRGEIVSLDAFHDLFLFHLCSGDPLSSVSVEPDVDIKRLEEVLNVMWADEFVSVATADVQQSLDKKCSAIEGDAP
ncbi:MAG: hypothetical protein AAFR65_03550 [Pseudomonadota bacterium]